MTSPNAGRASIEIVGDVSKLGRQLERDVQDAVDDMDIDFDKQVRAFDEFSRLAAAGVVKHLNEEGRAGVDEFFSGVAEVAEDAAEAIDEAFEDTSDKLGRGFRRNKRDANGFFDGLTDAARNAGEGINDSIIKPLRAGFSKLGDVVASLGSALVGLVASGTNPVGLALLVAEIAAFTLLIPAVIGLAGALADLAGALTLLPAAIGAAASALIVGMVAFQGFGDALSAVIDGDPDKIAEAMEKLAPAARSVVKEFQALLPLFRAVGDEIQQEFFEPLVGLVEQFGKRTLPALRDELGVLAQAMGRAFGHLGDLVNAGENVRILENLLAATARVTDTLGAAVADLGQAFFNALDAGLPMLERFADGLGEAITNFAGWINDSIEDGSFQEFFEDAVATFEELMGLAGALGELLGVLFGGTKDEGRDFIGTLTDLTQRMTEFFKSAEGQDAIEDFNELIEAAGIILGYLINAVRWFIDAFTELDDAVNATGDFFSDLWDKIVAVWDGIVAGISSAVDSVVQFFTDLWDKATAIWDGIVDGVASAVDSIVTWFQELPGRIWDFISSIPEMIGNLFSTMLDNALSVLAAGIATVIVIFTDGPKQIEGAFLWLWDRIVEIWDGIVQTVTDAINAVISFFAELPTKLGEIGQSILDWATETWNTVVQTVTDAVNAVVSFVSTLPGKIADFFKQLYDSAVAKLTSLVEFVKGIPGKILTALGNVGKMLFDSGKKIIQGLIDGINDKIGALKEKIKEAVQNIRDHLPFSPAKTGPLSGAGSPDIAGAKIAAMIAEGLRTGLPLITDAARASAGALADAGVPPLVSSIPGQPSPVMNPTSTVESQQVVFLLEIDGEVIEAAATKVVDRKVETEVRRLVAGTRGI